MLLLPSVISSHSCRGKQQWPKGSILPMPYSKFYSCFTKNLGTPGLPWDLIQSSKLPQLQGINSVSRLTLMGSRDTELCLTPDLLEMRQSAHEVWAQSLILNVLSFILSPAWKGRAQLGDLQQSERLIIHQFLKYTSIFFHFLSPLLWVTRTLCKA